ncbi:MAG: methyltransferase domain-containing protein [Kofleriaceae bacterium]
MPDEDRYFDHDLPRRLQVKSSLHFTPMAVARRAAQLLAPTPGMRVLDVGAGPGKFCLVAAQEVPTATFVGIEIRPHLVHTARKLADRLGVTNAIFLEGDALAADWSTYDAFYFYNPFAEQLHEQLFAIDHSIPLVPARFEHAVEEASRRLAEARIATRVVTYHSFGAAAPASYDLVERFPLGTDHLELWIKTR